MIVIDVKRCNGCGICIEICPEAAIYLIDGKATVDRALCRVCETCIAACSTEAIACASQTLVSQAVPDQVLVVQPKPEVILESTRPAFMPLGAKALPVVGATLAWAAREIVPRLAAYALDGLDRRMAERAAGGASVDESVGRRSWHTGGKGGRRYRHRRRGS